MFRRFTWGLLLLMPFSQLLAQSCTTPATSNSKVEAIGNPTNAFWAQQLRFPRVRAARAALAPKLTKLLVAKDIDPERLEVFIRLIKTKGGVEIWGRNAGQGPFRLVKNYPLAATSGDLGPKRQAGDNQVPEGFYEIDRFNPKSNYHLSLGLNYPNEYDRSLGDPSPGGDIFIHGSNVTIGCMPITDAGIEEVYLLAVQARAAGQAVIPVHIFPFPLVETEFAQHEDSPSLEFWRTLVNGYAYFEKNRQLAPAAQVAGSGSAAGALAAPR